MAGQHDGPVRVGVIGLGSVFEKYGRLLEDLTHQGRVRVVDVADMDRDRVAREADRFAISHPSGDGDALIARDDVEVVLVLTSMSAHGPLASAAYAAGKHVLVEKPMATDLDQARELVDMAATSDQLLVCAPHVLMSATYRRMYERVTAGDIGPVKLARALYGWSGPWWGPWFYSPGGGALFDLGVYNVTSLCGFLGSAQRVTALVGTAIPERIVDGAPVRVAADDNAHVLIDFGNQVFASVTTGFTIQKYGRAPAIELYGLQGTMNMLGDDWAPRGYEIWRNSHGAWEVFDETEPSWPWAYGIIHLVDCLEKGEPALTRPEQAYHALEIMRAAMRSAEEGRAIDIASSFPEPRFRGSSATDGRAVHDPT